MNLNKINSKLKNKVVQVEDTSNPSQHKVMFVQFGENWMKFVLVRSYNTYFIDFDNLASKIMHLLDISSGALSKDLAKFAQAYVEKNPEIQEDFVTGKGVLRNPEIDDNLKSNIKSRIEELVGQLRSLKEPFQHCGGGMAPTQLAEQFNDIFETSFSILGRKASEVYPVDVEGNICAVTATSQTDNGNLVFNSASTPILWCGERLSEEGNIDEPNTILVKQPDENVGQPD